MKEALKLALEALEKCRRDPRLKYEHPAYDKTITAIKEALAQPAQRTWVGLTEDEAFACKGRDYFETYKAIEAKLKEKNT